MNGLFISAIDTNVGKTVTSAIVCQALNADYWKPIQSGDLHNSDTMKLQQLSKETKVYPEAYALKHPVSPNKAAKMEGVEININDIVAPESNNFTVVEGAGGCLVPLNNKDFVIDLPVVFDLPVLLVSKNYLGSINHTLMSIEIIKRRGLKLLGVLIVGDENIETERSIEIMGETKILGHISWNPKANPAFIKEEAEKLAPALKEAIASL